MKAIVVLIISSICLTLSGQTESTGFLVIDKDGSGNIIFASEKITVGGEKAVTIKSDFLSGEQIWGRAYFPEIYRIYNVTADDLFFLEISIDNQIIQTVYQDHPEGDWGQMQVWVSGTDNDYFSSFQKTIGEAEPGKYQFTVKIGIKKLVSENEKDVSSSNSKKAKQKSYTDIIISKGSFNLIKV